MAGPSELDEQLERWRTAALITPSQAEAIRAYEERRAPERPAPAAAAPSGPAPASAPASPRREPPRQRPEFPQFGLGADLSGIDLQTLGAVLAGLALIALLGNIFSVIADLVVAPGSHVAADAEDTLHLVASVCGLVGGIRLWQGRAEGRGLVYWSLGINLVGTVLVGHSHLAQPSTVVALLTWVVLLVLVWRARYRGRYRYF